MWSLKVVSRISADSQEYFDIQLISSSNGQRKINKAVKVLALKDLAPLFEEFSAIIETEKEEVGRDSDLIR